MSNEENYMMGKKNVIQKLVNTFPIKNLPPHYRSNTKRPGGQHENRENHW